MSVGTFARTASPSGVMTQMSVKVLRQCQLDHARYQLYHLSFAATMAEHVVQHSPLYREHIHDKRKSVCQRVTRLTLLHPRPVYILSEP